MSHRLFKKIDEELDAILDDFNKNFHIPPILLMALKLKHSNKIQEIIRKHNKKNEEEE
ncbi:MAG: hypothetical protein WCW78_00260 [Candidatus Paceibacterota bacterium]|jgi:hypothetical protein